MLDTQPPGAPDAGQMDAEALLALTEDDLMAMPQELADQARELQSQVKDERDEAEKERQKRVQAIGQRIVGTYNTRLGQRRELEIRWNKDIRRYNGQYEPEAAKTLEERDFGSQMFVPLTRRISDIVEARMVDLLFPTEERSFAIDPSPVPFLIQAEVLANRLPPDQMIAGPGGEQMPANAVMLAVREQREEARNKADNMQREVDDQLREADFHAVARRVIHEAMVIGTGIVKGPTVIGRTKRVWKDGRMQTVEDLAPTVVDISAWDFFPDMSARTLKESESDIEVHNMTAAQLAGLANQPGFKAAADEIRRILKVEASVTPDAARDESKIASGTQGVRDPKYKILEYHGPVTYEELIDMGAQVPDDPLLVYEGVVFVHEADSTVLKAIVNPMDTMERPYRVYCWRKDPGSIFGFGLSHELADMQESANSSMRAAMDNMGLSVGGMLSVNDKLVRPDDGKWTIAPRKVYRGMKADADMRAAFHFVEIPNNLQDILAVFDRSKALMDDIGGPGMAMQGQEAPSYLETARGVSVAQNAANIWFRRGVTAWDDDITTPLVTGFVDWNMQYSTKDEIKGDLRVLARGRSALLEAEGQMQKMQIWGAAAKEVPMPFRRRVNQLKSLARSMRIDTTELLPDDAEIKQIGDKIDNQPPPLDPAVERIKMRQAELADNGAQRQHELQLKTMEFQMRSAELAANERITIEEAQKKYGLQEYTVTAKLQSEREQRSHDAQALNAELAVKLSSGSGV